MDLTILWSGNTPVSTLYSLWIPSMGTFDARVLIQPGAEVGRYAGTWQHGEAGGHMFELTRGGRISGKITDAESKAAPEPAAKAE